MFGLWWPDPKLRVINRLFPIENTKSATSTAPLLQIQTVYKELFFLVIFVRPSPQ